MSSRPSTAVCCTAPAIRSRPTHFGHRPNIRKESRAPPQGRRWRRRPESNRHFRVNDSRWATTPRFCISALPELRRCPWRHLALPLWEPLLTGRGLYFYNGGPAYVQSRWMAGPDSNRLPLAVLTSAHPYVLLRPCRRPKWAALFTPVSRGTQNHP